MQLSNLAWPQVPDHTNKVVVMPIAALEQHGHHLPLFTDSLICCAIATRAEAELGDSAVFLPLMWIGASDHHRAFPGTVSARLATYVALLEDMIESLIGSGFRRVFVLNAHAGNIMPAQTALYNVNLRHHATKPEMFLVFSSWFDLARKQVAGLDGVLQPSVLHACEWETAAIMATNPGLVHADKIKTTRTAFTSAFWSPDHTGETRVSVARTLDQTSLAGSLGWPERATAAMGERIIVAATREVVSFIREFATWPTPQPQTVRNQTE